MTLKRPSLDRAGSFEGKVDTHVDTYIAALRARPFKWPTPDPGTALVYLTTSLTTFVTTLRSLPHVVSPDAARGPRDARGVSAVSAHARVFRFFNAISRSRLEERERVFFMVTATN